MVGEATLPWWGRPLLQSKHIGFMHIAQYTTYTMVRHCGGKPVIQYCRYKRSMGGIIKTIGLSVHHTGSCDLAEHVSGMKYKGGVGNTWLKWCNETAFRAVLPNPPSPACSLEHSSSAFVLTPANTSISWCSLNVHSWYTHTVKPYLCYMARP